MNWTDLLVLAIIIGFGFVCMTKGFIMSVFRLVSFFISIFLAIKLYPYVSDFLMKTPLFIGIKDAISENLRSQLTAQSPGINTETKKATTDAILGNLQLPGFLKDLLENRLPNITEMLPMDSIIIKISTELAEMVMGVISLVALYIVIRLILLFTKAILEGIANLPLFKQIDKIGGFALGAVEGLLTVYILFTILMFFQTSPNFKGVFDAINGSIVANYIFNHNFIVNWMFPQKG